MEFGINVGMMKEITKVVTNHDTAMSFGSGTVSVLATPVMIGWMENVALNLVLDVLPEGYDTVGTYIGSSHIAATPVGMKVRVIAEVVEVEGKKITFKVKAYDEMDKIGEGTHTRAIIDVERFLEKTNKKGK